jgi:hypothetical protein
MASLATISLAAGGGIPVYVSSFTLISRLVLQGLLQLHSLSRILFSIHGLLAATGSSSSGTASPVSTSSGTARPPPSTQSGMSP